MNDYETWVEGGVVPTLNSFDCGDTRATVVIAFDNSYRDGLRLQKGNTINTLTSKMGTRGNNVPFIAQETNMTFAIDGYNQTISDDVYHTIDARTYKGDDLIAQETDMTDPTLSFDTQFGSNANVFEDVAPTVKSSQQSPSIQSGMVVRRLSPVECERLMGWPDNHTLPRADGKINSDTTRYKMCGNGVASPVAQWIGEQLMKITDGNR